MRIIIFTPLPIHRFWRGMYGRFESGVHPREPLNDLLLASMDHTTSLEDHVHHLTKRIVNFKNLITNSAKRLQTASRLRSADKSGEVNDNKYVYSNAVQWDIYWWANWSCLSGLSSRKSWVNCHVPTTIILWNLVACHFRPFRVAAQKVNRQNSQLECNIFMVLHIFGYTDQSDNIEVQLNRELNSVAVDWKGLRASTACACKTPFDQSTRKSNCWRCGDVFCARCINNTIALPGHDSNNPVPVCRDCYRIVQQNSP